MPEPPDARADVAPAGQGEAPAPEDRHLRRSLGYWQLTAIGFSGVIGSGWLLASMVAAQIAGPEAIVAWLVGGAVLALIALFASGFHGGNFSSRGGFAPYGWAPGLSAIATAGIIYAYTGFQGPVDLSGEARNPRRDVPRAVLTSLALSALLYLLLQVVFVGAVPGHDLIHGWHGVSFSSPFAQLAVAANLTWLSWVLYADAIASPAGSALAFTAAAGRESFAMAKNRFLPRAAGKVDERSGVPRRALVINFVIGLAFLLPLHSWQSIVAATAVLALIAYALPAVSAAVLPRPGGPS
jgi:amino acid transporter